ncbi:MAG TPA: hypothetical protein VGE95_17045 [Arthrobacter sp.]
MGSFDDGETVAETAVLPCSGLLTWPGLERVLAEWNDNGQCWGRAMTDYLVELYNRTSHLGAERGRLWEPILDEVREDPRLYGRIEARLGLTAEPSQSKHPGVPARFQRQIDEQDGVGSGGDTKASESALLPGGGR